MASKLTKKIFQKVSQKMSQQVSQKNVPKMGKQVGRLGQEVFNFPRKFAFTLIPLFRYCKVSF